MGAEQALLNMIIQRQTAQAVAPQPAMTPADPPHDYSGKGGLLGRLFPDRDPTTGEQGGILANPLFRMGLNLLAKSGPAPRPHSLGQDIAGAVNDYAAQRDADVPVAGAYVGNKVKSQAWKELQDKNSWADSLDPAELLAAMTNPSGNPDAIKAQTPTTALASSTAIPKGYEAFKDLFEQTQKANPDLPAGILPALGEIESSFNPKAVGPSIVTKHGSWNAQGIGQFNPHTAQSLGIDPLDPTQAIPGMAKYLQQNLKMYGGDLDKTLAAYGGGLVNGQITPNGQVYVNKVKAAMAKYAGGQPQVQSPVEETAQPQVAPPQFSGSGLGTAAEPTPGYPAQPQAPVPFPPSPGAQASAPPTNIVPPAAPQASAPPSAPVGGPSPQTPALAAGGPGVEGVGSTPSIPPLVPGPNGLPTKASILGALQALEPGARNQIILGAWMKASGNKREFAENLGESLLALTTKASGRTVSGTKVWGPLTSGFDDKDRPVTIRQNLVTGEIEEVPYQKSTTPSGRLLDPENNPEDAAVIRAATDEYRLSGKLPSGKYSGDLIPQILRQRAKDLTADNAGSVADDYLRRANLKSDGTALTKVRTIQAQNEIFEKTMLRNIDNLRATMKTGVGTDFTFINNWVQGIRYNLGSGEVPPFEANLITVLDEYAKILSGSFGNTQTSDALRKQAASMLNQYMSQDQITRVLDEAIIPDTQNKLKELELTVEGLQGRIRGDSDLHSKPETKKTIAPPKGSNIQSIEEIP